MTHDLSMILQQFLLPSAPVSCEPYGHGHINRTYQVVTQDGTRYILHRINHHVFRDVEGLMRNMQAVLAVLETQADDPRGVLRLCETKDGKVWYRDDRGEYWRVMSFVENSVCLEQAETAEDFYESAVAFGRFQQMLRDFPAETLVETIPNFHNTPDRYRIFRETLAADPVGRVETAWEEITFVLEREQEAGTIVQLLQEGKLPLRVTHNDTKLNNVMLDAETRKALCVIDLDTVMPGSALYDYGDSIRFGASSAVEDERDLSRVFLRLDLFEAYTRGYTTACTDLTPLELKLLPLSAKIITLEIGLRFLTDYLDGDRYFAIQRPEHNLDRCRTQFKLVADMEAKMKDMERIVQEVTQ